MIVSLRDNLVRLKDNYYTAELLAGNVDLRRLSRQMGNSDAMIECHN